MNPSSPSENKLIPKISLIQPEQISAAVQLFSVQLKEHMIEIDSNQVRGVIEKVVADESHGFVLVAATEEGELVGVAFGSSFLGMEHGGISGWLEELYVLPEWRQMGIGTRLVLEVIRIAKARSWRALDLEVEANHQRVVSLYGRHGFLPQSRSRFCRRLDLTV